MVINKSSGEINVKLFFKVFIYVTECVIVPVYVPVGVPDGTAIETTGVQVALLSPVIEVAETTDALESNAVAANSVSVTVPVLVGMPAVYLKSVAGIVVVKSLWVNAVINAVAVQLAPANAPRASVTVTAPISKDASDGEATVPNVPEAGAEILNPPPATVNVTVVDAA
jgi:hypothetical protein